MKIWTSEHTFDHSWDEVVYAAWRKYPNPLNTAITGIDVLRQELSQNGVLYSERIIQSRFPIPTWVTKLTGFSGTQYSHEITKIDPSKKSMTLVTKNLNGSSFLRVDEKLTYSPDPCNENKTILKQEAAVAVNLPAFTDYCESSFLNTYSSNALKGPKGIEWVISQFKLEYNGLSSKVSIGVPDYPDNMFAQVHS
uniref:PRELI/MSF1 domain-containing protein n=1 Tax=Syphacia muris TaxID=451379 RepID=A0A0N5AWY4_9BILA